MLATRITVLCGLALCLIGCATAPGTDHERQLLHADALETIETFTRIDPELQALLDKSAGYAVFPTIGRGGFIAAGAYGKGELFENGVDVGNCDISQATIGAQIGAQAFSELLVFEVGYAVKRFKANQFALTAEATAVILKSGAAANAKFADGVAVFTHVDGGAMLEAAVGAQQFTYKPKR
jgi:lipid-binding SYLF domain-containing protein